MAWWDAYSKFLLFKAKHVPLKSIRPNFEKFPSHSYENTDINLAIVFTTTQVLEK